MVATVVGVVADERDLLTAPAEPHVYVPILQHAAMPWIALVAHGRVDAAVIRTEIADAFARAEPAAASPQISTMPALVAASTQDDFALALLFAILAVITLTLAMAGIFGVRRAFGANAAMILRDVIVRACATSGIGIAIGLALSAIADQALRVQLYDVSPFDPMTFLSVIALFATSVCIAAIVPAARAARIEPSTALRYE